MLIVFPPPSPKREGRGPRGNQKEGVGLPPSSLPPLPQTPAVGLQSQSLFAQNPELKRGESKGEGGSSQFQTEG